MSQEESCSVCGKVAIPYSLCPQCNKAKRWFCEKCGSTKEQVHDECIGIKSAIFETAKEEVIRFSNDAKKGRKSIFQRKSNH